VSVEPSSRGNRQPGTLVKISQSGPADYITVGFYRVRQVRGGWNLYISNGGSWGTPTRFDRKADAIAAMSEHMLTGVVTGNRSPLVQRVAELEAAVEALQVSAGLR